MYGDSNIFDTSLLKKLSDQQKQSVFGLIVAFINGIVILRFRDHRIQQNFILAFKQILESNDTFIGFARRAMLKITFINCIANISTKYLRLGVAKMKNATNKQDLFANGIKKIERITVRQRILVT